MCKTNVIQSPVLFVDIKNFAKTNLVCCCWTALTSANLVSNTVNECGCKTGTETGNVELDRITKQFHGVIIDDMHARSL